MGAEGAGVGASTAISDADFQKLVERVKADLIAARDGDNGAYQRLENDFDVRGARIVDLFSLTLSQRLTWNILYNGWKQLKTSNAKKPPSDPTRITFTPAGLPVRQPTGRETVRAFADLRQFPRDTAFTVLARKKGVFPWERESLTYSEAKVGSIFGKGFVDNPLEFSPGERRVQAAKLHNAIRAQVRAWMDEGLTDEQIASELKAAESVSASTNPFVQAAFGPNGVVPNALEVPPDIRRRFGV